MSNEVFRREDPSLFRDILRLYRAARQLRNAARTLTTRQREAFKANGMGPSVAAVIAAVAMLEGYSRRRRQGE